MFTADEPGDGFVDAGIPELAIAVSRHRRGQGIGTVLLRKLLDLARSSGVPTLSLSVSTANPVAIALYRSSGFTTIRAHDDHILMVWQDHGLDARLLPDIPR
jgi:ribosomal protein S18 acetylase RimI-like enzyme